MVSSTTHVLNVVTHVKNKKNSLVIQHHHSISHPIRKRQLIYPNVSVLPGLLLEVVLAVHSAVDHQTTRAKFRQVGYQIKGLSMNIIVLHSSCLWVW